MIQDHSPIRIEKFKGLYGIDSFEDSVPSQFSIDELNAITNGDEIKTRDGFDVSQVTLPITKFEVYRRQGEAARIIALIGTSIWDLTTSTIILTVSGMTNFAIGYANNRAFISPHNGISGLPGSFVYIYNGTGVARKAAGLAPIAGFNVVASATSGVIEAGKHLFAWVFETDSGFTTGPGPAQILEVDGTTAVDFSSIPIGPVGTASRRLIASRAIQDYNGNEQGYEMFFVSGGRIENNVDTVLVGVDFYDADLQFSADYVYDQLAEIPATVFIRPYGNRMCYGGPDIDKNLVYISKALEAESIHSSAGFIPFDPFETEGVKDGTEFRDNFYVTKRTKTYAVRDNTYEPSTWKPVTLDASIGADINGIAQYLDSAGSKVEFFVACGPSGSYKFNGVYEEIPLTRNIKNTWKRINQIHLNKMEVKFDQERLRIYILLPLDGATVTSHILVGNYEGGFHPDLIKWHLWNFSAFNPTSILIDRDTNRKTVLKVAATTGSIYAQEDARRNDAGIRIVNYIRFNLIYLADNAITHCGAIGFRMQGGGILNLELFGQDSVDTAVLPSINLTCAPGKEFITLAHFQSEKVSLKVSTENVDEFFKIARITMYCNVIFFSRPLV